MAYSEISNGIKQEQTTHYHDILHAQLSAEDSRNIDNDSAEESGESPLDFSIKRKPTNYDEVSGSESLSSPASSLNDTGGHLEDRRSDTDGTGSHNKSTSSQESPPDRSPLFHHKQLKNELLRNDHSSIHERIGQPKTADNGGGMPNMLHDFHIGLANANMLANYPAMAALMDPRRFAAAKMGTRPFKAYPKDAFSSPSDVGAIPHYLSSFATFENSAIMQGLNLPSEEVFSLYKQQLIALRERDKYMESLKLSQEKNGSRNTSAASTSSPSASLPSSLSSIHLANAMASRSNGINNDNTLVGLGNIPKSSIGPLPSPSTFSTNSNGSSSDNLNHSIMAQSPSMPQLTAGGRRRPRSLPDEQKDEAYWERRRKNNEAAKRSRDARRAKEDQIAIRAALLEQENLKLRVEVAALKTETAKLRCMLYNS